MVEFTIFSIIINLLTNFVLSIILFFNKNRFFYYKLFNLNLILWSFFYLLWVIVADKNLALFFIQIDMIFVGLIPFLFFNFCVEYTKFKLNKFYKILNFLILIVLSGLMFTPLMINGIKPFLGFNYVINTGPLLILFFLYFVINVILGLILIFKQMQTDKKAIFIFCGTLIGFLGGITNFGICFNSPIPPYGNILITVYSIIIAYGILYYKVFDISFVFSKGIARVLTYLFFISTYGLLYYGLNIFHLTNSFILLGLTLIYIIFTWEAFSYINAKIQKIPDAFLLKGWYDANKLLLKIEDEVNKLTQKEKIFELTAKTLTTELELKNNAIILNQNLNQALVIYFQSKIESTEFKDIPPQIASLLSEHKVSENSVILPFSSPGTLDALLILGERKNQLSYKQEDFNFFKLLINNINSVLYKLTPYEQIEEEFKKAIELASITKIVVTLHHEINSPLTVILGCSLMLKEKDFAKEEVKKMSTMIHEQTQKVSEILRKLKNLINPVTVFYDSKTKIQMFDLNKE
ncbi:MAG: histidine kinase N-terminal 7TM domain-containing protein [Candidatus Margulisiibacteriota bacterium]|jgi:hypothetical protein